MYAEALAKIKAHFLSLLVLKQDLTAENALSIQQVANA
jgi:hypothetical protein